MDLINLRRVGKKITKENKARRRYAVKVSGLLFGRWFHLQIIKEGEQMIERAAAESTFSLKANSKPICLQCRRFVASKKFIISWERGRLNNDTEGKRKR